MSRKCEFCGKSPSSGRNVSHSHRVTTRRFDANVQKVEALIDGRSKTVYACTRCLKAGKVVRPSK